MNFLEQLTIINLINIYPDFMKSYSSSPCSQKPTSEPYLDLI